MIQSVRDFDEKSGQDKEKKLDGIMDETETMERFLGLKKYLYFFCKSIILNICYIIITTITYSYVHT